MIAARRFEDVSRRLPKASTADFAAIATPDLLDYLESLSDVARRAVPDGLWRELKRRRPTEAELVLKIAGRLMLAGLAADAGLAIDAALQAAEVRGSLVWSWIMMLIGLGLPAEARAQLGGPYAQHLDRVSFECAAALMRQADRPCRHAKALGARRPAEIHVIEMEVETPIEHPRSRTRRPGSAQPVVAPQP